MKTDPFVPGGGDHPRLPVLLLVAAIAVTAAQSESWASAVGAAAAVYSAIVGSSQNRGN
ncbi:hypothetical protein [Streptomyces sp. NPDC001820]|uniref:hypothetical protein n=1 Tax=Streptomyces sp. NPDC001820 TaxID=3364613 RepID=UPI00369DA7EC